MADFVRQITSCSTGTATLVTAARVLEKHGELAYNPDVEKAVFAAMAVLDPTTPLLPETVRVLQQFYKFPYGISA